MSQAGGVSGGHPIEAALTRCEAELDGLVDAELWSMDTPCVAASLERWTRLVAAAHEVQARLAAEAETREVGLDTGATSTAVWWANQTRQTRVQTHAEVRLGQALSRCQATRRVLAEGRIMVDQARVISRAVEDLTEVTEEMRARAESWLLEQAQHHDAKDLRMLARRLVEVADPESADAREAEALAKQEREALAATSLTMSNDGEGRCHGRFTLPEVEGAMLKKALLAIAAPKHQHSLDAEQRIAWTQPSKHKLGRAFLEYIRGYPAESLPAAGGVNATVVVTTTLDALQTGLAAAQLDTCERLSPGLTRRLACEAGIIPAVLDGMSQVLDLGRTKRLHTKAQRIALAIEQGGCTAEGCDWPPGMCHAHHDQPWARGGATDTKSGRLLCPKHHHLIHDPQYETTHLPNGRVAFHRRT